MKLLQNIEMIVLSDNQTKDLKQIYRLTQALIATDF